MCKCGYLSVAFVALLSLVNSQVQDGSPCKIPNGPNGICIYVYECKVVTDILSRSSLTFEARNYVRSLSCGQRNGRPYVCCPQLSTRDTNTIQPVNPTAATEEELLYKEKFILPPKCGLSNASHPKVVGGIPAKLGDFPWMVALGYQNRKNPNIPRWLCGGTLITFRHVLTAAHCVQNRPDLYIARVGELDLYVDDDGANPKNVRITNAKVHEEFSSTKFINDIAILTLSESVEDVAGVTPICLPFEDHIRTKSYVGAQPMVAGWGAINFNGPSSSVLQKVKIPIIDNSQCEKVFAKQSIIDDTIICAGYSEGGKDSCQGDSGGPLMYGTSNRSERGILFYQIGVISYGRRCAEAGIPAVYTRVTKFLNWIGKNLD
ncbi:unnamed protein product [Ceutorhynchus assimilis]|uniref:CLIP domain-containing serine protease n=1 Tax=Ceutorhynchus assimilis TaxID=467358 RepID=A0A9N9QIH3_9CUCU|nr:unnamed protein product [Ceutorhynchus assimilis]